MKCRWLPFVGVCLAVIPAVAQEQAAFPSDPPKICDACGPWNERREPFRVFGNTYYVGVAGLSSVLVASKNGHILIDGDLPQSAAVIDGNIRSLGFRTEDVRLIVASHEHFDHVGGIAALQRKSGAVVAASSTAARAIEKGEPTPDDPQYGFGHESISFPPVPKVRVVVDGEALRVGDLTMTAHRTPGHTPGSTTWTWLSCEGPRCLNIVYADSLNPVSAPGFRFSQHQELVDDFKKSIATIRNLPCDILLSVHPEFSGLDEKVRLRRQGANPDPFIDSNSCRLYAGRAARSLQKRILEEMRPKKAAYPP